jgi:hypothetical protein
MSTSRFQPKFCEKFGGECTPFRLKISAGLASANDAPLPRFFQGDFDHLPDCLERRGAQFLW